MQLFQHLDVNNCGTICANELYDYMSKHYLAPRMSDAQDIIREYDGSQDSRLNFGYSNLKRQYLRVSLNFDEFCQLALPSTSPHLRHSAETKRHSPYHQARAPIPYDVLSLFTRLLEKEMQLQRTRNESQR